MAQTAKAPPIMSAILDFMRVIPVWRYPGYPIAAGAVGALRAGIAAAANGIADHSQ
jgi:hypothetical protein